jgi:hexosaminidase
MLEPDRPTEGSHTSLNSNSLIPHPASVSAREGSFNLAANTHILVTDATDETRAIGQHLSDRLRPATGYELAVIDAGETQAAGNIHLSLIENADLGEEGYRLTITPAGVTLEAYQPAGLFWGAQTIRLLLPPSIEQPSVQPDPWEIPVGTITDYPRFNWRGMMLDVARHLFSVEDVKRVIDLMALYKMNRLHLHLTDDQGWRLMIESWPNLAAYGGSTAVDSEPGGFYTQADYTEIVAYARSRYITIVPEIDMPGHTNAALASYPELNCDGVAPPLYTGIEVGFSSLCVEKEITYRFIDEMLDEVAALTPGPYLHVGGDEAHSTNRTDYVRFMDRVQDIVATHGKQMVGWAEIAQADLEPTSIAQVWNTTPQAVDEATKNLSAQPDIPVILSPASLVYLDMKYNHDSPLGLQWAGYVDVKTAYDWDPATWADGLSEDRILGVEAPLWSETLLTIDDVEYMMFPRLLCIAEINWSPATTRSWEEFRYRLGVEGIRLAALDVNFYRSPLVDWQD